MSCTERQHAILMPLCLIILQAEAHVLRSLYEAIQKDPTAGLNRGYPPTWQPQSAANTELFEVALTSMEAKALVQAVQASGAVTVVKVASLHKHLHMDSTLSTTHMELRPLQIGSPLNTHGVYNFSTKRNNSLCMELRPLSTGSPLIHTWVVQLPHSM